MKVFGFSFSTAIKHIESCMCGCLTLSNRKRCRIDQEQKDVVKKALKHRSVGMIIVREVLAGQTDSTDEQRQDLTQCQREYELPANEPDQESVWHHKNQREGQGRITLISIM